MKIGTFWVAASAVAVAVLLPNAASAGTRANDSKIVYPAAAPAASTAQGPKGGFPNTPGLAIATIKANDNAAFKRNKSNGT